MHSINPDLPWFKYLTETGRCTAGGFDPLEFWVTEGYKGTGAHAWINPIE